MVVKAKQTRQRRALALVEMALIMPLLILLTLGVLEYSWMFLKAQQVTNASRAGARAGARIDATAAVIENAVLAAMTASSLNGSGYVLTLSPADLSTLSPGEALGVTVSVTYANIDLGLPMIPTPSSLTSTTTMAREGESE